MRVFTPQFADAGLTAPLGQVQARSSLVAVQLDRSTSALNKFAVDATWTISSVTTTPKLSTADAAGAADEAVGGAPNPCQRRAARAAAEAAAKAIAGGSRKSSLLPRLRSQPKTPKPAVVVLPGSSSDDDCDLQPPPNQARGRGRPRPEPVPLTSPDAAPPLRRSRMTVDDAPEYTVGQKLAQEATAKALRDAEAAREESKRLLGVQRRATAAAEEAAAAAAAAQKPAVAQHYGPPPPLSSFAQPSHLLYAYPPAPSFGQHTYTPMGQPAYPPQPMYSQQAYSQQMGTYALFQQQAFGRLPRHDTGTSVQSQLSVLDALRSVGTSAGDGATSLEAVRAIQAVGANLAAAEAPPLAVHGAWQPFAHYPAAHVPHPPYYGYMAPGAGGGPGQYQAVPHPGGSAVPPHGPGSGWVSHPPPNGHPPPPGPQW